MRTISVLFAGVLSSGACASSGSNQSGAEVAAANAPAGEAAMCPMAVEGSTAAAEEPEGAAAMAFTTDGDVAELRRRVSQMAEMHNRHHAEGNMMGMPPGGGPHAHGAGEGVSHGHAEASGGMMGMGKGMMVPAASARSEDIEGGARLVLTPRDPADLPALRQHVGRHAEQMAAGHCPMMSMGAEGGEKPAAEPDKEDHEAHHPPGDDR